MKFLLPVLGTSLASAHTIFSSLEVGGTNYGVGNGVRVPSYNGPIEDVTSNSLACNGPPNPTSPTSQVITVQAGQTVTAVWRYMLNSGGSGPADVMDSSHKGPTIAYLKKVGDATSDSGVGGGWFKIQQDGFSGGVWGTEKVINGQGKHAIKIPECIAPGQYLLRAEMIALHGAGSYPGAQFYMECAQINVVGGTGAKTPANTVSFPGAYKSSDPGVTINIYWPVVTSYTIPGPALFTC
ncbi:endoglucanase II (glycosyl hydrolase family 61) [Colletotrichum sojae]|uniref:lytic cellulose monooxygenase (C4-dehydrogenating) n=1 Tax=Colletotrichum sojae TaxID=2175907 RepID=A0A8H6MT56_9PEZI|nr:endoglucanase II (glycosyl hydrolase family 61) [Colletotrichum sojae]